eukprot:TRINITY_DN1458_c0_g1_i5.p1 TRINITY_DN1458_c0_g1~~TRINITY_DN1458_c0_g1_i5.p1  ORF type:complete len:293 (+),score=78.25 TRINITY_DN1458_c0_g1_i5:60-881(+)
MGDSENGSVESSTRKGDCLYSDDKLGSNYLGCNRGSIPNVPGGIDEHKHDNFPQCQTNDNVVPALPTDSVSETPVSEPVKQVKKRRRRKKSKVKKVVSKPLFGLNEEKKVAVPKENTVVSFSSVVSAAKKTVYRKKEKRKIVNWSTKERLFLKGNASSVSITTASVVNVAQTLRIVAGDSTVVARSATKFSKNSYNKELPSVPVAENLEKKKEIEKVIPQTEQKESVEEKIFYYDCSVYMYTIRRSQRGYIKPLPKSASLQRKLRRRKNFVET